MRKWSIGHEISQPDYNLWAPAQGSGRGPGCPPAGCARFHGVIKVRKAAVVASSVIAGFFLLVLTPAAMAADGVGLAGRVNDLYLTFFCFAVIAFFAAFVIIMSLIQGRLDAKKEQRRHDLDRFNS